MTRIELPLPPSVNGAYATNFKTKRRYLSKDAQLWKEEAGWLINLERPAKIRGPYRLKIMVAKNMAGDCSNRVKLAEDLLVEYGITPDDRHAESVLVERSEVVEPGRCVIEISAANEPAVLIL